MPTLTVCAYMRDRTPHTHTRTPTASATQLHTTHSESQHLTTISHTHTPAPIALVPRPGAADNVARARTGVGVELTSGTDAAATSAGGEIAASGGAGASVAGSGVASLLARDASSSPALADTSTSANVDARTATRSDCDGCEGAPVSNDRVRNESCRMRRSLDAGTAVVAYADVVAAAAIADGIANTLTLAALGATPDATAPTSAAYDVDCSDSC
jgi:hypothetical protein